MSHFSGDYDHDQSEGTASWHARERFMVEGVRVIADIKSVSSTEWVQEVEENMVPNWITEHCIQNC